MKRPFLWAWLIRFSLLQPWFYKELRSCAWFSMELISKVLFYVCYKTQYDQKLVADTFVKDELPDVQVTWEKSLTTSKRHVWGMKQNIKF